MTAMKPSSLGLSSLARSLSSGSNIHPICWPHWGHTHTWHRSHYQVTVTCHSLSSCSQDTRCGHWSSPPLPDIPWWPGSDTDNDILTQIMAVTTQIRSESDPCPLLKVITENSKPAGFLSLSTGTMRLEPNMEVFLLSRKWGESGDTRSRPGSATSRPQLLQRTELWSWLSLELLSLSDLEQVTKILTNTVTWSRKHFILVCLQISWSKYFCLLPNV